MPELPEVELVKRSLTSLIGLKIKDVVFSDTVISGHKNDRMTIVKEPIESFLNIRNSTIINIKRRSKYMYFELMNDEGILYMISHLGMSGGFFIVNTLDEITEANYKKHWHVQFHLSNGQILVYSDIRRFGEVRTIRDLNDFLPFKNMAPEYTEGTAKNYFVETLKSKRYENSYIKAIIMDAKIIPGVGNIYASEALYRSGILPTRRVKNISKKRLELLFDKIVEVFELSLNAGGSTISDYRSTTGESGSMQTKFKVYGQKFCPKGHEIKTKTIGQRNTYYCTTCQR
ncbi:bifunctional DNA-formamidopyrimidine glycosylase/DNA-(apurinic or apyrimidinic site) lyase [Nosocomiicoccus ampullae]|uniref:bifunctional DNA-formamidopyrimidine glycosylase/DNA-(apurinic or apyrimidinic site) lyase n=1 Tax=Nosocomiicoccus ampullae TaxID=489910 RepID=UPI00254AD99D|nr:bifunctional DNA-formamidopyrimidine glycosylase/DNA-(apurinic or apyrimidinic site) lyase [Nosocomiicoccus ampullae]MDK6863154.1 bifunctional DNA-formamidopyrimidine glycosylase/DNA-(apurinic or apyrimidinic site) lyase [Nosocomiicoccus ampullae]